VHRVTQPPGGGSNNIFGCAPATTAEPRRRSNNTESSIFAVETSPSAAPTRTPKEDTQNRLFGEPEPLTPVTSSVHHANGESQSNGKDRLNTDVSPTQFIRVRQPPGGVSSKLW